MQFITVTALLTATIAVAAPGAVNKRVEQANVMNCAEDCMDLLPEPVGFAICLAGCLPSVEESLAANGTGKRAVDPPIEKRAEGAIVEKRDVMDCFGTCLPFAEEIITYPVCLGACMASQ